MASQDYISQFSQGIPPTQPDRSPSRTPRRDISTTPYETSVPAFRGPLHMGTTHYRNPNVGYTHTWTPPRLPLTPSSTPPASAHWPRMQHQGYPTQPLFPPMPPTPPPPQGSTAPQRFTTTSPKSHSSTPPPSMSQIYPVRPCEIPAMPNWKPDVDFHDSGKVNGIDFPATVRSSNSCSTRILKGWILCRFLSGNFCIRGSTRHGYVASLMDATSSSFPSITSGRPSSSPSWYSNSRPETWTWTVWPLFGANSKASTSSRRRQHSIWLKNGHVCNIKVILHSHSSLQCHLHRHRLRDLRHLNASLRLLPNHTPPRLHPPCHRFTQSARARFQLCQIGNQTSISMTAAKSMASISRPPFDPAILAVQGY